MAIELVSVAPVQPKPGAGRAPDRGAPAEGEESFASALSASSAAPAPERKAAPAPAVAPAPAAASAPARSATKKSEANENRQDEGAEIDDGVGAAGGDVGQGIDTGKRGAVAADADAGEVTTAAAAASAATAVTASTVDTAAIRLSPQPLQPPPEQTASLPLPAESAMLLAQSALTGAPVRDANPRSAAVTPLAALPLTHALPSTGAVAGTVPTIAADKSPATASPQLAAVLPVVLPVVTPASREPDLALQAPSTRSVDARAVPVAATSAARTPDADGFMVSTTPVAVVSFSSANPQQTQRAVAQAQVQAQVVVDRAALQASTATATTTLDSRAAESLAAAGVAAGMLGGTSIDASASPLLRRFERVLSMTHAASGEGQTFGGGGATTASTWMTPVNSAGAAATASMGGMTDRLADSMNSLLAQVVAQKNHNASLTVDVGGQPVSVNVQVQGNEAQVVFRADQAETRAMLAQALPQLKQMMGAEGLLLSDASVAGQWTGGGAQAGAGGSSGAGDADPRRGTTFAVRLDTGTPATGAAAGTTARTLGTRSLDLYV